MGSDRSPHVLFDAVIQSAKQLDPSVELLVITTKECAESFASRVPTTSAAKIEFYFAPDVINMRDEPLLAVRHKKGSSLVVGVKLLKKKALDAFVTSGNTGALITCATLMLPFFPGIRRPALLALLPTETGSVAVIDVGGNVSCKAHHLVQFAEMGLAFQSCHRGIEKPRIGLLNIGIESKKGTREVQQAYQVLKEKEEQGAPLHFVGNVEGREVFQGKVDLLVTDGFTGNVLLKTSEGVASFILETIKRSLGPPLTHLQEHAFQQLQHHFNYAEHPGAILLGVEGIIIKCHGDATSKALLNSIKGAISFVEKKLVVKLKNCL